MIYKISFICFATFFILIGCSNGNQNDKSNAETSLPEQEDTFADLNVIKVYVEQDGKIAANGKEISLTILDSSFDRLKERNGTVYYSRANGMEDPPQESMKVMELIVKYGLPVKLFTDKTFTVIIKSN